MVLRPWTESDLETIANIEKRCFPEDAWTKKMLESGLHTPYGWSVLAERGGQVCGYACLFSLFETAELLNIAVDIPYRRQGVGERLMTALHEKARELGAQRIMLEVRASNAAAIALYRKYGYEKISVRKGYYSGGEDADIMEKIL